MVLWGMNKKTAAVIAFTLLFAAQASAIESELVLSVNNYNQLFVERLLDDDGSIGLVDVCILTLGELSYGLGRPTLSECHQFENVIEGQVLNIEVAKELQTANLAPAEAIKGLRKISFAVASVLNPTECIDPITGFPLESNLCGSSAPACGDGLCSGETCGSCQLDCGPCAPTPAPDVAAAYYNFADFDGTVTNAKFLIFASSPVIAPAVEQVGEAQTENRVLSKSLAPTISEDKKSFFVDAKVKFNDFAAAQQVDYLWAINNGSLLARQPMALGPDGEWHAKIGPFKEPVKIHSFIEATLPGNKKHLESLNPRLLYLITPDGNGTCKTVTFSSTAKNTTVPATNSGQQVSFQTSQSAQAGWSGDVSRIKIFPTPLLPNQFKVTEIIDDSGTIDFLNIFEISGSQASVYAFQNVTVGQILTLSATSPNRTVVDLSGTPNVGALAQRKLFYNFMDTDYPVGNLNFLLPLEASDLVDATKFLPADRTTPIENVEIDVVPQPDCTSFKLRVKAKTSSQADVQKVFLKYGFKHYSLDEESGALSQIAIPAGQATLPASNESVLELQGTGETFEGEIGPFSSFFEFFSRVYAEAGGETSNWQNPFSWFGIEPAVQAPQKEEICGNKLDDDGDGNVDEGCVQIPELVFVGEAMIPSFVTAGDRINASATIKNSGLSNTTAFQVSFYLNEQAVDSVQLETLVVGEETRIDFSIFDSIEFLGINNAKIVIDPANSVPELNENNNESLAEVAVGYNSFNIVLNYNKADLIGDTREIRAFSVQGGQPESNVKATITFPSGQKQEVSTNTKGLGSFLLNQPGTYVLSAQKDKFDAFEASFTVPKITLQDIAQRYDLGAPVAFIVETDAGKKVPDAAIAIKDPNGQVTVLRLDAAGQGIFQPKTGGTHTITVSRKGINVFTGNFLVAGGVESLFVAGGIQELLFGSISRDPPLFILMIILSVGAAVIAFSRSKLLFKVGAKSSRKEQLENVARLALGVVFFLLPFQAANILGFNAGLALVVIEGLGAFLFEYYKKRMGKGRPEIRVR